MKESPKDSAPAAPSIEVRTLDDPIVDDPGVALASDDVWQANNRAQQNVDQFGPTHESPFDPVEFEFSVNNSAKWPELVYCTTVLPAPAAIQLRA